MILRAAGLKNVYKIDHALQSLCYLSYDETVINLITPVANPIIGLLPILT